MPTAQYTCKLDASGWQLYTFEPDEIANGKPDHNKVAKTLSDTLTSLVRIAKDRLRAEPCLSEHKLATQIRDVMYKLMATYANAGASDTEPQCVLVDELETAFGLETYSLDR